MLWECIAVGIGVLLIALTMGLNTASVKRSVTIAGKTFQDTVAVTGQHGVVVEKSVNKAYAGTMTAQAQTSKTVSTVTWLANVATFTTTAPHGYTVGQIVTVASVSPSGYNADYVIVSVPTSATFTVALLANPGTYSSGGTVTSYHTLTCTVTNPFVPANLLDVYSGTAPSVVCLRGATVSRVVGLAVAFTVAGAGGSVPANTTAVKSAIPTQLTLNFTGANLQTFAIYSDILGQFRFMATDGTTENAQYLMQSDQYTYIWDNQGPIANPFAGVTNASVYVSHYDTTAAQTLRIGILSND